MNAAIAGAKHPQNAAIEGYVLNTRIGILPLYPVEAVPSDFYAAKPDVPPFRAPLYRATYYSLYTYMYEPHENSKLFRPIKHFGGRIFTTTTAVQAQKQTV